LAPSRIEIIMAGLAPAIDVSAPASSAWMAETNGVQSVFDRYAVRDTDFFEGARFDA
jgi:hypothetical protein